MKKLHNLPGFLYAQAATGLVGFSALGRIAAWSLVEPLDGRDTHP
jgi:hypothetical protein